MSQRFLAVYSGMLTIVFAATVLGGFAAPSKTATFDEIVVQRIKVVEPDGTLRLVISNKARFPGAIIKGKEYTHVRDTAGILFFNDEGTENGGLSFNGRKDAKGNVTSNGHLSFDQYMQDQVFTIDASESGGRRAVRLAVVDRPDYPITEILELLQRTAKLPAEEQAAERKKFLDARPAPRTRLSLGRNDDRSVGLRLKDTEGRDRLVIQVDKDGKPVVQFLDESGKVVSQLPQG